MIGRVDDSFPFDVGAPDPTPRQLLLRLSFAKCRDDRADYRSPDMSVHGDIAQDGYMVHDGER